MFTASEHDGWLFLFFEVEAGAAGAFGVGTLRQELVKEVDGIGIQFDLVCAETVVALGANSTAIEHTVGVLTRVKNSGLAPALA